MSGLQRPQLPKKEFFRTLVEGGPSVMVHFDPRKPGVVVPPQFKNQPQLILEVGYRTTPRIEDLEFEGEAIMCTLSFRRVPFLCRMPWDAIFALVNKQTGQGMVWADDVPPEIAAQMAPPPPKPRLAEVPKQVEEPKAAEPKLAETKLAETKTEATATEAEPSAEPAAEKGSKKGKSKKGSKKASKKAEAATESVQPEAPAPVAAEPVPAPEPAPMAPAPAAQSAGSAPGSKPRRELPSYLRVIK